MPTPLRPVENQPSSSLAARKDYGAWGGNYEFPIKIPVPKTSSPPTTTWKAAESSGEERRQGRNRAIHQPRKSGLDYLEEEEAPLGIAFLLLDLCRNVFRLEFLRPRLVSALLRREIAQQLPDGGIGRMSALALVRSSAV